MENKNAIVIRAADRATEQALACVSRGPVSMDDGDREIAAIFAARGLTFDTGRAVVVGPDEIRRQEAMDIYIRKTKLNLRALIGPACAMAVLFCGFSFGWIAPGFFKFLVVGCVTWAIATVWG